MAAGETPTVRHAARVVLLDDTSRVLLARFEYLRRVWWVDSREVSSARRRTNKPRGERSRRRRTWTSGV